MSTGLHRWPRESPVAPAAVPGTVRRDLAIAAIACFAWLALLQGFAWPSADWATPTIVLICVGYSLAICKTLRVAPVARPLFAVTPVIVALGAIEWTSPPDPSWLTRRELVGETVAFASLGYFFLAVYRIGAGYVLRTPDGGTDGLDTDRLLREVESVRSRLFTRRTLKILFPNTEWEDWLRSSFRTTQDQVTFAELSPETIRANDLVVPLKIRELVELDRYRSLLVGNPIPVPSKECVALCDDKYLLNRALIARGFGAHVPDMDAALPYPYVLKKRRDEWAVNSHVIAGPAQEQALSHLLDDLDYFRQRFVPGRSEYTTHILMRDRRIVSSLCIKFVFKDDLYTKGRECTATYSKICRSTHLELFASMLRSIGFEGLCCVNYKLVDGHPWLFEINPRFGASLVPWFPIFVGRVLRRRPAQAES